MSMVPFWKPSLLRVALPLVIYGAVEYTTVRGSLQSCCESDVATAKFPHVFFFVQALYGTKRSQARTSRIPSLMNHTKGSKLLQAAVHYPRHMASWTVVQLLMHAHVDRFTRALA